MQSGEGKNYNGSKKESSKEESCEESSKEDCKEEDYKETIVFSQNSAKAEFCVFKPHCTTIFFALYYRYENRHQNNQFNINRFDHSIC